MKAYKSISLILILVLFAILVSACGPKATPAPEVTTSPLDGIKLSDVPNEPATEFGDEFYDEAFGNTSNSGNSDGSSVDPATTEAPAEAANSDTLGTDPNIELLDQSPGDETLPATNAFQTNATLHADLETTIVGEYLNIISNMTEFTEPKVETGSPESCAGKNMYKSIYIVVNDGHSNVYVVGSSTVLYLNNRQETTGSSRITIANFIFQQFHDSNGWFVCWLQ